MTVLKWLAIVLIVVVLVTLLAAQLGALSGRMPDDLGIKNGKLKRPSRTDNSVSSQARDWPGDMAQASYIEPIAVPAGCSGRDRLMQVRQALTDMPGVKVVTARDDYVYAQATTRLMKYVDDVECWLDEPAGVIHVRSASRVGRKDLGANRARVEALRNRLP